MSQVSKRLINKKTQEKIFELFILSLVLSDNKKDALLLIQDLFTPVERLMLSKRFSIAYMLLKGYDYDSISEVLKVSRTTIGKVSYWLKEKGSGFRNIINKIKHKEAFKSILNEIQDAFEDILSSSKGQNWSRAKKQLWTHRLERQQPF